MQHSVIGRPVPRKEGRDKVTGRAKYVDDLKFPGMLHGTTVRSEAPRGRVKGIHFDPAIPWHEFTIVTAKDIPGENAVALITLDQPYLADEFVNHPEEPVLLLAHQDKYLLEEARRRVQIDIEPLPAIFSLEDSLARKQIVWGEDNVFKTFLVDKGDVDSAWASAAHIVEGEYSTGAQEQLYIETNGALAIANPHDGVTIWGSLQCPYYVHKALLKLFPLPAEKIRIIQAETGGGFGGKEEYPSMIAGHAALLAWKSGRAVKIVYDRAEDMAATTKRHPSRTRHRTAVDKNGKLLAMEIEFVIDGGAYSTLSPVVLSRGTIHGAGPYYCPNVRIRSKAVATNCPPHGAFRGFGAPQSIFALERHLNKVARAVGLTPEELRRRNFIRQGQITATGQVIKEDVRFDQLLERAFEATGYREKHTRFARENQAGSQRTGREPAEPYRGGNRVTRGEAARLTMSPDNRCARVPQNIRRGIGFATFMHGAGFTGSGERTLASVAGVEAGADGRVTILVASTEIGQGTNTILSQIVAEALGIAYEDVNLAQPDTAEVPNSGPTVASRTCMVVGKLVESAAIGLRQTLITHVNLEPAYTPEQFRGACARYVEKFGALRSFSQYQAPPGIYWDDQTNRGDAYAAYAWAVYVAEVSIDTVTYEARIDDFTAVQEVGRVIHPVLAAGQIEGGVAQAIGFALYEDVVWKDGRMVNNQMTNYIIPTAADIPPIRVIFEERPYSEGPGGAKGIGELPMDGPAPAIANAIENALGVPIDRIPILPETLINLVAQEERALARTGAR